MLISLSLPIWLASLICFASITAISLFYWIKLKGQKTNIRVALVLLRAVSTLGLLLIILDATITRPEHKRSRLLITTSDLPLMRLPDAGGGATRNEQAEKLSLDLSNDARLASSFIVHQASGQDATKAALDLIAQSDDPLSAVVHITDSSEAGIQEAESISKFARAPLFIIPVTRDDQIPDLSVLSIDSGGIAQLDQPQTITATVAGRAVAGRSALIKLSDEGIIVAQSAINWKEAIERVAVPLLLMPKVEGLHRLVAKVEPLEGELNTENNAASFSIDVRPRELKILFIENQPTWEGKFIRRALEGNSSIAVDYFAQISRAATLGQQQSGIATSLRSILGDLKKLARYDVVIAGPLESSLLSEREARNITEFVDRRGGGLVILGGNDFNGSILSPSSRLAHLSPASIVVTSRSESGLDRSSPDAPPGEKTITGKTSIAPTREGESLFFNYRNNLLIDRAGPISSGHLKIKALKPGATALAIDGAEPNAEKNILIASRSYGFGRTMLVAPADLWRVQLAETNENEGAFAALCQNIVFWAATNAAPASSLRLRTSRIERGDLVAAYLTVRDDSFNPVMNLTIKASLEIEAERGKVTYEPVTITRDPASPGVYELNTRASDEGKGNLSVELKAKEPIAHLLEVAFDIQSKKSEWRESFDASDRLARLAQTTGGELTDKAQLEGLKSKLSQLRPEGRASPATYSLRNSIALAFLLPLLMAGEYFIRRRLIGS